MIIYQLLQTLVAIVCLNTEFEFMLFVSQNNSAVPFYKNLFYKNTRPRNESLRPKKDKANGFMYIAFMSLLWSNNALLIPK